MVLVSSMMDVAGDDAGSRRSVSIVGVHFSADKPSTGAKFSAATVFAENATRPSAAAAVAGCDDLTFCCGSA